MSAPGGWVCGVLLLLLFVAPKVSFHVEAGMQRGKTMHEGVITGGRGDTPCAVRDGGNGLRRIGSTGILLPEQLLQGIESQEVVAVFPYQVNHPCYTRSEAQSPDMRSRLPFAFVVQCRHCILQGKWNYCDYFTSLCPSCFHFWYLLIFCGSC